MAMTGTFGRYRAKMNPFQSVSAETKTSWQQSADTHEFIPSKLALTTWQARGLPLPNLDAIRVYRLQRHIQLCSSPRRRAPLASHFPKGEPARGSYV